MSFLTEEQKDALRTLLSSPIALALGAVAVGILILLCLFIVLLLRPDETADATPPPPPIATPGLPIIPDDDPLVVGISDSTEISVSLAAPVTLDFGGRNWNVQTQTIPADGVWSPAIPDGGTAVWLFGTVVNYVMGLTDTPENRAALEQLTPGEEMRVRMSNGAVFTFAFNSRRNVPVTGRDIFNQQAPGLTLLLVGSGGQERLIVYGRHLVTETDDLASVDNTVDLGETVQLDGLQFTVTGAAYVFDRPEIPAGFAFYLVDYQVQNVAGTLFNSNLLRLTLADELGNQYAFNPIASQIGNHPPLGGALNPNQLLTATAGYQIPAGLSSASLRWQITRADNNNQAQVMIPFRDRQEQAQQAAITLTQAEVSVDGASLLLIGQLTNLGNETLAVQESNVSLTSEGSVYLILSTSPGFPWLIAPGQTAQFSVTFQRPVGGTAVFTVLNQPFELTGLR